MIKAGELDKKIVLQVKSRIKDSDGYSAETWSDVMTPWAAVKTTGGGEFYAAQKLNADTECLFKIRYLANVNKKIMRIKYGNRYFDILHVNDVEARHEELLISAKEVV